MTLSTIDGFNLDKALDFLGPLNYEEYAPRSLGDHLLIIIKNIVVHILRQFNYYFGDQKWYDNQTARAIVITYINQEKNLELTSDCHKKVAQIFEELHFRSFDELSSSYAANLAEMAYEKGIDFLIEDISDSLDFGVLPQHNLYQINNGILTHKSTGNLTLKADLEKRKSLIKNDKARAELIFLQSLPLIEKRYREMKMFLDVDPKIAEEKYAAMFKDLLKRSDFPDGYKEDGSLIDPSLSLDIEYFNFDKEYGCLKDPLLLFDKALIRASNELLLSQKFNQHLHEPFHFDQEGALLKNQGFFSFFSFFRSRNLTDNEIDNLCAFAVIDLLRHACIDYTDCHHKVYFSPTISASYQKPFVAFVKIYEKSWPICTFKRDLFSSEHVGADPEAAYCFVKEIENLGNIDHFKNAIKNRNFSSFSTIERMAYNLIKVMAKHLKLNYLESVRKLYLPVSSVKKQGFEEVVKEAKSSTEFFRQAFLYFAQEYANLGLFDQEDLTNENISLIQSLLAKKIVYETLILATIKDDFTLNLNDFVELKFGTFFSYEINQDNTSELICKERAIENELFDSDFDSSHSLDPIYTAWLFKSIQTSKSGSSELDFLRLALLSQLEFNLFKSKYFTDELQDDLDESFKNYDFKVKNTQFLLRKLSKSSRKVINELRYGIFGMASSLVQNYFKKKDMAQEIFENVTFSSPSKPKIPSENLFDILKTDIREAKEVEFRFIPESLRPHITIKHRRERLDLLDECHRADKLSYYTYASLKNAVSMQNDIITNVAQVGNCGFGALAMEIFEGYANSFNIDKLSWQLREITANYIRTNSQNYLEKMLREGENFEPSMAFKLSQRLESYCRSLNCGSWITELEFEVISCLFGVPIEIINLDLPCKVGSNGIDVGLILPNLCYGSNFKGSPIRLILKNGNHFEVIKLKKTKKY